MKSTLKIGDRVQVTACSGLDSFVTGVIVSPREVKTDGRGVPLILGHYKPANYHNEFAIRRDDNGQLMTMFKNRLHKIPKGLPTNARS